MKVIILNLVLLLIMKLTVAQMPHTIDSLSKLALLQKNDSVKAALFYKIGDIYDSDSKLDSALVFYEKTFDLNKKIKNPVLQIDVGQRMAHAYNSIGNYPEALRLCLETLNLEEQLHDTEYIFYTKREIMWVYGNIGEHVKELTLAKGLEEFANSGYFKDSKKVRLYNWIVYNNTSNIYEEMDRMDSALFYRTKAFRLSQEDQDLQLLALSMASVADSYRKTGNIDSSFYYSRLAILYGTEAKRSDIIIHVGLNLAYLFQKAKLPDSAFYYAASALNDYRDVPDTSGMMETALLLSDLYKSKNKIDSAYRYLSYYNLLQEKSLTNEKIKKVQNLSFNETLHQQQLEQQQKEATQQYETKIKLYSLCVGLLALILIAATLYRSNQRKQKAKIEIENAYKQLKSTQAQLVQSEKMASLGELTSGIAHEIQNPLNFVNNFSEVNKELVEELQSELKSGNTEEAIVISNDIKNNEEKINHHGKRADAIVKGMLQHSRANTGKKEPTDINVLADEYLRLSYHGMRAKDKLFNAKFETDFDPSVGTINIVPQDIGRVFLNLINNAFYAVNQKQKTETGKFEPCVSVKTKKVDGKIEIAVKDNGNGISQKILDKIFQPFFTTKPTGQGTGLGLSLSYDIIKAHGGEIKVETREREGSEFIIQLPL